MELIFQQEIITFDGTPTAEEVIVKINELLENGYYFSHFIVDGEEVHGEHEDFLERYLGQLVRVEVIAKTVKEFVNDLFLSAEEYLERAVPELPILAEEFYDNPKPETWGKLDDLLGGLQWLDGMLMVIGQNGTVPYNWETYLTISSSMQEEIRNFAEAIENEDNVLIGDIIQYEILPNFEELGNEVKKTIDNEGMRHDLN
ncbi:hypothetical protein AB1K83_07855 [Sporosarcina sp. 179-K 3D1 HS]|uniref:hypothetical protein n=1 Tax=Sporosarcina sp. 179-K 3D1 HS TaxID=3232169 RepID=UPI0039A04B6F